MSWAQEQAQAEAPAEVVVELLLAEAETVVAEKLRVVVATEGLVSHIRA